MHGSDAGYNLSSGQALARETFDRPMHQIDIDMDNAIDALNPQDSTPVLPTTDERQAERARQEREQEQAMLMAPTRDGGGSASRIDWLRYAKPAEMVVLALCGVLLLWAGWLGDYWIYGANEHLYLVSAGLYHLHPSEELMRATGVSRAGIACEPDVAPVGSVMCDLATAGEAAGAFVWSGVFIALCLGGATYAESLDGEGKLGSMLVSLRAKLPPAITIKRLRKVPALLWALLSLCIYLALLTYAARAPATMGAGLTKLGSSYGQVRLTLLLALAGLCIHVTLIQGVGETHVLLLLDGLHDSWLHMARRRKIVQALLAVGLGCELLLWVKRVEYGVLILVYGLYGHTTSSQRHLALFTVAAILSVGTDALALASDQTPGGLLAPLLTWLLLLCKVGAVGALVYHRDVFP